MLHRLKKTSDFQRVGKTGNKVNTVSFVMLSAPNEAAQTRVGYTVSKQVSKLAVERNRIKRRLRAVVREVLAKSGKTGTDYVIIGRKIVLTRDHKDIIKDMQYAISKIHPAGAD